MEPFCTDTPYVLTELVKFRPRIGEFGMKLILKECIRHNLLIDDYRKEETMGTDDKDGCGRKSYAEQIAFIDVRLKRLEGVSRLRDQSSDGWA